MKPSNWILLAGAIAILTLAGCGAKTNQVTGKIIYPDGTSMPGGGQVMFISTDPSAKTSSRGMIKDDGSYTMGTFAETDGVLAGTYKIAVVPTPPKNIGNPPPGWPPLQKKYMDANTSGLEYTVTRGRNKHDITVEK
jgi:hypothetical protein